MKKVSSVDDYTASLTQFKDEIIHLRKIINTTELVETLKWGAPAYTLDGKNVIGLAAFKNHFGIWFFNGVFLKDEQRLLVNAQENKTKALRQMRFTSKKNIDDTTVLLYINEAIENQRKGLVMKPKRNIKAVIIPRDLDEELVKNNILKDAFSGLTPGKQREYCEYIASAKREDTKRIRLEKIKPMIMDGIGLNDKYKK